MRSRRSRSTGDSRSHPRVGTLRISFTARRLLLPRTTVRQREGVRLPSSSRSSARWSRKLTKRSAGSNTCAISGSPLIPNFFQRLSNFVGSGAHPLAPLAVMSGNDGSGLMRKGFKSERGIACAMPPNASSIRLPQLTAITAFSDRRGTDPNARCVPGKNARDLANARSKRYRNRDVDYRNGWRS
jgi:hypothetical protein